MGYPPLLGLLNVEAFRKHFESLYCQQPIVTFDGISVRFRKEDFDHCCFESSQRNGIKDCFSLPRAERLGWIREALQDPRSDRYIGWDSSKKRYDPHRRVTVVMGDYVVVIAITGYESARFVTAFVADSPETITKIKTAPRWAIKNR
ncbi:MAG: hypothetical protein HQL56_01860 [Magnetococcales bacterium]|nr:hypothetical protein [Magnetococcales bacterium]